MAVNIREQEAAVQFTARDYNFLTTFLSTHARTWMSGVLALADIGALLLAGLLALELRTFFGMISAVDLSVYAGIAPLVLIFVAIFAARGLYPAIGLGPVEELRRLVINTTLVFLILTALTFLNQTPPIYSRFIYLITWIFALVFVPLNRFFVRSALTRLRVWGEPVAIIGQAEYAAQISALLRRSPGMGLKPTLVCARGGAGGGEHGGGCPAVSGRQALQMPATGREAACRQCPAPMARMAFVVYSDYTELSAVREKYREAFERVVLVNHVNHGLDLSMVNVREFGGLSGLEIRQNLLDHWAQRQKRLLDILGATVGLMLLSPFFLLIAILIYVDSPGRIFYRQMRVGKGGRHFKLLKFRTMHLNADAVLQSYLQKDPALKLEWDQYQKLHKDPRITRVGSVLRRFSIDELTQLWNVLIGEMSLVGPRPMMVNQVDAYGEPYEHYIRVRPGITGLWQVSGRNKTTFARRAQFDVNYVMSWSVWLDLYLLIRTVWVVLTRDGAA